MQRSYSRQQEAPHDDATSGPPNCPTDQQASCATIAHPKKEIPMTDTLVVVDEVVADPAVEELLAHGEETLTGVILVTRAYFKEKNLPFDDLIRYAGSSLAPSWDEVKGQGARELARLISLNYVAAGAELHDLQGDDNYAKITATWPHEEDLEFLGLTGGDLR